MKYPRIMAEIERTHWAITEDGLRAIRSAAESDVKPEDYQFYHALDKEARDMLAQSFGTALSGTRQAFVNGNVGVLDIEGPIIPRSTPFTDASGLSSFESLSNDYKALTKTKGVNHIAMVFDSPGGAVTGTSEFNKLIASSDIKTTSFIAGMGASAAYWAAVAADEIVSIDTGAVGSIGVLNRSRVGGDDGEVITVSSQSPDKRPDMTTEKGRAPIQREVNELADVFIGAVATGRGVSTEKVVKDFGRGGVLVAKSALAAGMIDRIESFESFMGRATGATTGATQEIQATITEPAVTAGETKEGHIMDLTQFLAENPAAADELKSRLQAAHAQGKTDAATAQTQRIEAARPFLDGEYPDKIKALAAQAVTGDLDVSALKVAVALHDTNKEELASLRAQIESNEVGSTQEAPELTAQQNEIAEANAIRKTEGKPALGLEV